MNTDTPTTIELDAAGRPTKAWLERVYVQEGLSTKDIARLTGRGSGRISMLLREYGITTRQPPSRPDRSWLEQRYVTEHLSVDEIAAQASMKPNRVYYLLRAFGIPVRRVNRRTLRPTAEWLQQKYVVEGLSTRQMCELTGYSKSGLERLLRAHGIAVKGRSLPRLAITRDELYQLHVVEGLTAVRIAARYSVNHASISRLIRSYHLDPCRPLVNEPVAPPLSRDVLWKLYWVDLLSVGDIAKQYGVHQTTALRWFRNLDVPRRRWNGGEIQHTYLRTRSDGPERRFGREFNALERERILARDGYQCRMPGCTCTEAWRLEVHHIIPITHGGTNSLENGITLCATCHASINRRELEFATLLQELVNQHS